MSYRTDPERTTAIAMTCYRCGRNISAGYWLADDGPLCSKCGQDVRAVNTAKNRERETMEKPEYRYLNEKRLNGAWYALYDLQFSELVSGPIAKDTLQGARHIVAEAILMLRRGIEP